MRRVVVLATLCLVLSGSVAGQATSVLHIRVALRNDAQTMPVPRYRLLISDNPASSAPRRVLTAPDGTVDVRLLPGSYIVESDQPVSFQGRAYGWTQVVEVVAGTDTSLDLTVDNAEIASGSSVGSATGAPLETDPSFLLPQWQDSVVGVWTRSSRASGFLVDARGLIATNQRAVGDSVTADVQVTATVKLAARVVEMDPARDVAILWINPAAIGSVRALPLGCAEATRPSPTEGKKVFAIGAPLRGQKTLTSGTLDRVEGRRSVFADLNLPFGGAGGPVFDTRGDVVGITSVLEDPDGRPDRDFRVVPVDDACRLVDVAEERMASAAPPSAAHLPVEPSRPFPQAALEDLAKRRAGGLGAYQMAASDFDIAFITPVVAYAAQQQYPASRRDYSSRTLDTMLQARRLTDFERWSDYVADFPPVLLIRVTPKLAESFWTTVGRAAAWTQGVGLPAIKQFKPGFSHMRVFCGNAEVMPIHPFKLDLRVSESDAIREGLYVFDPGTLGPSCDAVKLVLHSEKDPDRGHTHIVDRKMVEQIWQDFAPLREAQ
jgi:S1-C subfamily serine protease